MTDIDYFLEALKNAPLKLKDSDTIRLFNFSELEDQEIISTLKTGSADTDSTANILVLYNPPVHFNVKSLIEKNLNLNRGTLVVFSRRGATLALSKKQDSALLEEFQLRPLFREPLGKMSQLPAPLTAVGSKLLPNSKLYSPLSLHIYSTSKDIESDYVEQSSLINRVKRITERVSYKMRNSITHHYYEKSLMLINKTFIGNLFFHPKHPSPIPKKTKKHIAIITGQLDVGGVESVLLSICKSLSRQYTLTLYTTSWNANPWTNKFSDVVDYVEHIPKHLGHKWPAKFTTKYLAAELNRQKPDAIFITNSTSGYKALPLLNFTPIVVDLLHTHGTPKEKDAFLRISYPYDRFITRRIVISNYLKRYLQSKYAIDEKKISTIYNGVNHDNLEQSKSSPANARNKSSVLTYIGRLQADKSPRRIIEATYLIKDFLQSNGISIKIVGNGSLKESLVSRAHDLGLLNTLIHFEEFTNTPLRTMRLSKFTILCSTMEGISMSALESMSVGTPLIATAVGGTPEIIENLENGLLSTLHPSEDETIRELAQTIKNAFSLDDDSYSAMSTSAKEKIRNTFSSMDRDYLELFESLLK